MKKLKNKIIKYIALGYTSDEIGQIFGYSPSTIKAYVITLLREYEADNRHQLVLKYLKQEKNIDIIKMFDK